MSVTVLLPVYNAEKFLKECLDSILCQTYSEFELIACNDGSRDSSLAILNEYAAQDSRIRLLDNPQNIGIVGTRNRLLAELSTETKFVAWIDADDVCFPDRFQRQVDFLNEHPQIGGVGSSLEIIDENSIPTGFRSYPQQPMEIRKLLPRKNILAQPAMMLRREVICKTGIYSEKCPVCQDYEYWLRAIEYFDFANLEKPVLHYRISKEQVKQNKLKLSLAITLQIQKEYYRRIDRKMPPPVMAHQLAGHLLMLLPAKWIMKLFCLLTYQNKKS